MRGRDPRIIERDFMHHSRRVCGPRCHFWCGEGLVGPGVMGMEIMVVMGVIGFPGTCALGTLGTLGILGVTRVEHYICMH